jgi:mRNA-degrading endonuclease HigB of HigAB toxin-antitoxin module
MDNSGNAIIVWMQKDNTGHNQAFMSENRNGKWNHPADIDDNISLNGQNAFGPQVAMDSNGNAIIVWYQSDGSEYRVYKSEYHNGKWQHPSDVNDRIGLDGPGAWNPKVAMDNNGNAIIVWYESNFSTYFQVFKSEYRDGTWKHPSSLNEAISPAGSLAHDPLISMASGGNALIVWKQQDGTGKYQIFKSEYRDGKWTTAADLADNISADGTNAGEPQVAMDDNGNAVIVWTQSDGSNTQVYKNEYR